MAEDSWGREVRQVRSDALLKVKGGLRAVYRTLELPGKNPLKDAHAALDEAVMGAYGFDGKGDLLGQLLALNQAVAAAEKAGPSTGSGQGPSTGSGQASVQGPGVPRGYPDAGRLVSGDCIGV